MEARRCRFRGDIHAWTAARSPDAQRGRIHGSFTGLAQGRGLHGSRPPATSGSQPFGTRAPPLRDVTPCTPSPESGQLRQPRSISGSGAVFVGWLIEWGPPHGGASNGRSPCVRRDSEAPRDSGSHRTKGGRSPGQEDGTGATQKARRPGGERHTMVTVTVETALKCEQCGSSSFVREDGVVKCLLCSREVRGHHKERAGEAAKNRCSSGDLSPPSASTRSACAGRSASTFTPVRTSLDRLSGVA